MLMIQALQGKATSPTTVAPVRNNRFANRAAGRRRPPPTRKNTESKVWVYRRLGNLNRLGRLSAVRRPAAGPAPLTAAWAGSRYNLLARSVSLLGMPTRGRAETRAMVTRATRTRPDARTRDSEERVFGTLRPRLPRPSWGRAGDVLPGPGARRGRDEGGVSPQFPQGTCVDALLGPWPGRDVIIQTSA